LKCIKRAVKGIAGVRPLLRDQVYSGYLASAIIAFSAIASHTTQQVVLYLIDFIRDFSLELH
jgi:hypothetical protein